MFDDVDWGQVKQETIKIAIGIATTIFVILFILFVAIGNQVSNGYSHAETEADARSILAARHKGGSTKTQAEWFE